MKVATSFSKTTIMNSTLMKNLPDHISRTALIILTWLACQIAPSARAASYDISMTANGFVPSYLAVTVGDRVYWWNDDPNGDHSTVSYTYSWDSGPVPPGYGVYIDTTQTGSYDYTDDVGFSGSGTLVINPAGPPPPTLISAPSRVDMIYDAGRDIVYITSGSTVLRYQLASDSFLTPIQLSGNLMGVDISPDGNTLLVADSSANSSNVWVHVINLNTGQTNRAFFPIAFGESGTFAVAFGSDGAALVSSRFAGSGWVPLRRYDPASGTVTTISSFVRQDSMVSSSGDGSTIIVAESNDSGGPMDLYDVATRKFIKTGGTGRFNYECAASRDGSLFALPTYFGTYIYDRAFNQITNIGVYAGAQPIGAAFHPAADAVFFPFAGTTYVEAYSTTTWQMLAQYDFQNTFSTPGNHAFTNGRIRISPDGQVIFVTVSGGVRYLRHGLNVPLTHRLQVAGSPAPYGAPTPVAYGTYWLPDGTNLTINVPAFAQTNGTTAICTGWTGTGSASGSGTNTQASFTLLANTTLTWDWTPFATSANVTSQPGGPQILLQWPSLSGQSYDVLFATNLLGPYSPVATNLTATPPINVYQGSIGPARTGFYKVRMN
jgi:plastocyanin